MSESFTEPPSDAALRIKAIETLLLEKKIIAPGAVDEVVDLFENKLGPRNGAQVVARAWTDPEYRNAYSLMAPPQSWRWDSRVFRAST